MAEQTSTEITPVNENIEPTYESGGFTSFIPLLLIFVVFYFFLIRPQEKKRKELEEMVKTTKKNDKVVAAGGIVGIVEKIDLEKNMAILNTGNNTIEVLQSSIIDNLTAKEKAAKQKTTKK